MARDRGDDMPSSYGDNVVLTVHAPRPGNARQATLWPTPPCC